MGTQAREPWGVREDTGEWVNPRNSLLKLFWLFRSKVSSSASLSCWAAGQGGPLIQVLRGWRPSSVCCGPRVPRGLRHLVWLPDSELLPPVCSPGATFSSQPTAPHTGVPLGGSFCKHEAPHLLGI